MSAGSMVTVSQPSALAAVQHRALALRAAGDLATACDLLEDAIEAARFSLGEDHRDVLAAGHMLAQLHREADDPMAARRVLEVAFAAGERRWGHRDPLLLAISFDLASVAEELGNRHEARRNYSRVATEGPAVLGAEHPAVQEARRYLGDAAPAPPQPDLARQVDPVPAVASTEAPARPVVTSTEAAVPAVPPPASFVNPPTTAAPAGVSAYPMSTATRRTVRRRRGPVVAVVAGGGALGVAALVGAALLLIGSGREATISAPTAPPSPPSAAASPSPQAAGPPPAGLRLRDGGATITLTWADPSDGAIPFVVAGGRAGQRLGAMATVDPGRTRYTVNGLNSRVDYCFTVLAVYSTDAYATSGQVCTNRERSTAPR